MAALTFRTNDILEVEALISKVLNELPLIRVNPRLYKVLVNRRVFKEIVLI